MKEFLENAAGLKDTLVADRRHLHQNAEPSGHLPETTAYVVKRLREIGLTPREVCTYGIVADIGPGNGKTLLLRADMDALPMMEESGLEFASQTGSTHACGHDLHTAMLLGAAKLLKEREEKLKGRVRLMFQPDEETLTGARTMVEAGVLDGVDVAMGLHVYTGEESPGYASYLPGPFMSSQDRFVIRVKGKGGHGAMPHETVDPINVAAHIYLSLQEVIVREIDTRQPAVITIGSFHSGTAANIIPESAVLEGTIRCFDPEVRAFAKKRLVDISRLTAEMFRAECDVEFISQIPPNTNDKALTEECAGYLEEIGLKTSPLSLVMGSEDFACVAEKVPSFFFYLSAGGEESVYRNAQSHNPKVCYNEDALPYGAAALSGLAFKWLQNNG